MLEGSLQLGVPLIGVSLQTTDDGATDRVRTRVPQRVGSTTAPHSHPGLRRTVLFNRTHADVSFRRSLISMSAHLSIRRLLGCLAMVSCTAVGALFGAERATVILRDGERMSGTLVSRSDRGNRGRDGRGVDNLTLRTDDGRELGIPIDRLAVIELGSARPAQGELDALPSDGMQMIVRRNGTREAGQFIGISENGVVSWQGRNGRQEMIPSREVTRITSTPAVPERLSTTPEEPVQASETSRAAAVGATPALATDAIQSAQTTRAAGTGATITAAPGVGLKMRQAPARSASKPTGPGRAPM